jgi:hypothetical protein
MEATDFSEMVVPIYQTMQHHISEDDKVCFILKFGKALYKITEIN